MLKILLLADIGKDNYIRAIEACGAEAVLYDGSHLDTSYNGIVLCGGSDICPKYYNQEINGSINTNLARDEREILYLKEFLKTEKPILGICRGHQLLNVVLGGSLIQDIPQKLQHTQEMGKDRYHSVVSKENSLFNKLYGKEFCVNSSHHQGIDKLGSGLIPTLYCKNIIEGCEHITKPYITAQFHPERMCLEYENSQTVNGLKIFEHFIDLTKKYS